MHVITRLALGAAFCLIGAAARAEQGCILDNCADRRASPIEQQDRYQQRGYGRDSDRRYDQRRDYGGGQRARPRGPSTPGDFDFYVFSLSWSSGFCATGGAEKGKAQCAPGSHLGFVVHGLWPQYERGFPQDCRGGSPSFIAMRQAEGLFPDQGLARYEWRKHGTCSGKAPADYFADVRRARDSIVVPPQFSQARGDARVSPAEILRAFESANPRLRPGMAAVGCQRGVLQEVRFCMTKDLRDFRPCPEVVQQSCRAPQVAIPAPL
ncbi:MAG: ribonuclease T2 [Hyphomicrobiales bacterium]|nr:ribonuclease T2 [Hyphomicrobiales bacterium]